MTDPYLSVEHRYLETSNHNTVLFGHNHSVDDCFEVCQK